jgi:putative DNA primase/helicase
VAIVSPFETNEREFDLLWESSRPALDAFGTHSPQATSDNGDSRWTLQSFNEVQPRQVKWLVPGFIPLRAFTLVAGVGGLGKSTWLVGQAAELSRQGIDSIIVSFEDTAAEIIRPRLEAANADLSHVHNVILRDADGIDTMALPRDLDNLGELVREAEAKLVIIDPIVAALETTFDAHKDQHVRHILGSLVRLAEEEDAAVTGVGHLNKTPSSDAYIRVANSVAFWNAARTVVLITEDGTDDDSRLVAQRKANWGRMRPVERHWIEEIVLPDTLDPETGDPIVTSRMVFVEVAEDVAGADVLLSDKPTKTESAETLLAAILADGEWHESAPVKAVMKAAGYAGRTIQRASKFIGVEVERRGMPASTWWCLSTIPSSGASEPLVAPVLDAPMSPTRNGATAETARTSHSEATDAPVAPDLEGMPDWERKWHQRRDGGA